MILNGKPLLFFLGTLGKWARPSRWHSLAIEPNEEIFATFANYGLAEQMVPCLAHRVACIDKPGQNRDLVRMMLQR